VSQAIARDLRRRYGPDFQIVLASSGAEALTILAEFALRDRSIALIMSDLQADAGQVVDLEMALFEADRGNAERAEELARAASEARPDNVFTADALAWALHRSGKSAAALPYVARALRLGSVDTAVRYHAAVIAAAVGDEQAARQHLDRAGPGLAWAAPQHMAAAEELSAQLGSP